MIADDNARGAIVPIIIPYPRIYVRDYPAHFADRERFRAATGLDPRPSLSDATGRLRRLRTFPVDLAW